MEGFAATTAQLGPGWEAFLDPQSYVRYGTILLLAALSGALFAYHPVLRGRPMHVADIEQQKTLIVYSVVGALIAVVCSVAPSMAFVIFGIGGLMRFRTETGASKSTGHTIMATLIGLCWGLGLQLVAVFATVFFWCLVYVLERSVVVELIVGGVPIREMGPASDAYRGAIDKAGATLLAHHKNFKKEQMSFVLRLPSKLPMETVVAGVDGIDDKLRGTPHWPA